MRREQIVKGNLFDKITFCHKIYSLKENTVVHDQNITFINHTTLKFLGRDMRKIRNSFFARKEFEYM